ncbi:MAG: hypothetical protein R3A43_05000 [Bacteroidia bacterium]
MSLIAKNGKNWQQRNGGNHGLNDNESTRGSSTFWSEKADQYVQGLEDELDKLVGGYDKLILGNEVYNSTYK